MHETHHDTGEGDAVHTTLSESDAKALREDRLRGPLKVTIGDIDLPAFVSGRKLYLQAPLPLVFKAFAEDLPAFLRDMEVRISGEGSGSFSLDSNGRAVPRARLVVSRLVRRRKVGR